MAAEETTDDNFVLVPDNWISIYADGLYNFACNRISDPIKAQDIVQDTFLSAWKAREGYKAVASEKNWLYAICKNKIKDHYRRTSREIATSFGAFDPAFFDGERDWLPTARPMEWNISTTAGLNTKEFYKVLEQCKSKLQELQRAVFVLKYFDDMDSVEICKELEISASNYWTLMHRAKLQLRGCIEKNWFSTR